MQEVAPGVFVETQYESGNVGFLTTGAGVVCIDAPMLPRDLHHWKAQIASTTEEPIIALVQTDYDQERVLGSALLGASIIAHDAAFDKMKVYTSDKVLGQIADIVQSDAGGEPWQVRMPETTFSERLILHKGSREIYLMHAGGHSPATCMAYLPSEAIIFTGDVVFNRMHPSVAQAETKEWLAALTQLRKMPVNTIVPGHGPVCDKEATHVLSEYIRDLRAAVRRSFQMGRSKSETSTAVIPDFMDAFPFRQSEKDRIRQLVKGGSDRIYDEYRAEAKATAAKAKDVS
jgi:cyclase